MLYFTSDLHLGHANVIKFNDRPFSDVNEMNEVLIQNMNEVVSKDDELWILGDFAYRISTQEVKELREKIICKNVHLVYGNHDKDYSEENIFQSVQSYKELKTEYGKVILFHYPILEWNAGHYGSIHLHGHIHSTGEYNEKNPQLKYKDRFQEGHTAMNEELNLRIYDVGVDANHFRPISLVEIADLMQVPLVK